MQCFYSFRRFVFQLSRFNLKTPEELKYKYIVFYALLVFKFFIYLVSFHMFAIRTNKSLLVFPHEKLLQNIFIQFFEKTYFQKLFRIIPIFKKKFFLFFFFFIKNYEQYRGQYWISFVYSLPKITNAAVGLWSTILFINYCKHWNHTSNRNLLIILEEASKLCFQRLHQNIQVTKRLLSKKNN